MAKNNFIDNKEFYNLILEWLKTLSFRLTVKSRSINKIIETKEFTDVFECHKYKQNFNKKDFIIKILPVNFNPEESLLVPNNIAQVIKIMIDRYIKLHSFSSYTYKDEMKSLAMLYCMKYAYNFDPNRTNPFAYFTRIIWSSFMRVIKEEAKRGKIKKELYDNYFFIDGNSVSKKNGNDMDNISFCDNEAASYFAPIKITKNNKVTVLNTIEEYIEYNKDNIIRLIKERIPYKKICSNLNMTMDNLNDFISNNPEIYIGNHK